jgi:hypothetical protein
MCFYPDPELIEGEGQDRVGILLKMTTRQDQKSLDRLCEDEIQHPL